jgi:hypothetical protein
VCHARSAESRVLSRGFAMIAQAVTCETVAAVALHAEPRPQALCDRPVARDTQVRVSVDTITRHSCRAAHEQELRR